MDRSLEIKNPCTTQLTLRCRAQDRERIKAMIPLVPDDELPCSLVYGLEQSDYFGGTWEDLDLQLYLTVQLLSEAAEALANARKSFNISYRLEAYCDFYWKEKRSDQYWSGDMLWFMDKIGAELAVEVKWREEQMWRHGLPQRHMTPEPDWEEIGSMEELETVGRTLRDILDTVARHDGLFTLCGNPGFGKTTLQMQLMCQVAKRRNGKVCVFTQELTKAQYLGRMEALGLDIDNVVIMDEIHTVAEVNAFLRGIDCLSLVVIDRPSLLKEKVYAKLLKQLSRDLFVPILVTGELSRASGEHARGGRPTVWDMESYTLRDYSDLILLLHRDHSMERGIGHTERYDISNEAEIIVGKNRFEGFFDAAMIRWDPRRSCFDLSDRCAASAGTSPE